MVAASIALQTSQADLRLDQRSPRRAFGPAGPRSDRGRRDLHGGARCIRSFSWLARSGAAWEGCSSFR